MRVHFGFTHQFDNRYLWMNLKRIVGSHFANYRESWEANRLIDRGLIHPTLSKSYALEDTGRATLDVHRNVHHGKVGVLCLAPEEGLGVRDTEKRARHLAASTRSARCTGIPADDGGRTPMLVMSTVGMRDCPGGVWPIRAVRAAQARTARRATTPQGL